MAGGHGLHRLGPSRRNRRRWGPFPTAGAAASRHRSGEWPAPMPGGSQRARLPGGYAVSSPDGGEDRNAMADGRIVARGSPAEPRPILSSVVVRGHPLAGAHRPLGARRDVQRCSRWAGHSAAADAGAAAAPSPPRPRGPCWKLLHPRRHRETIARGGTCALRHGSRAILAARTACFGSTSTGKLCPLHRLRTVADYGPMEAAPVEPRTAAGSACIQTQ